MVDRHSFIDDYLEEEDFPSVLNGKLYESGCL